MTHELSTQVENGLRAFEAFKSEVTPLLAKAKELDGFDASKLNKMEKAIGDAIELSQKEAGERKALEAQVKALETVVSRPGASAAKEDGVELATKSFNDFMRSDTTERTDFRDYIKRSGKELELKDLSVNVDYNGGFLVIPTFGGIVQTKVFETSPVRQLANVQTISSDAFEVVVDYDETGASWVGETTARSNTTTPAVSKVNIPAMEMSISVQATQKILDDAAVDMESWLAMKVADKAARLEATAFISGNGVSAPRGILTYAAGSTITSGQIEQVNAGSTSAFTYAGLVDLQNSLKEVYQANATFLTKRASFGNMMKIVDGQSRPIFNMSFDKNTGLSNGILGRPLMFADDMPSIASAALAAVYGDFKAAYTIVDRIGLRTLRDPYTNKPYVVFYTTKRVGGSVVNFEALKIQKMS